MPTPRWLAAGLVLALALPATAQDAKPVKLEWKFEKDKTFYQTITLETTQTLKSAGTDVVQKARQTFFLGWTPVKQEDKNWVLRMKVEGAQVDIDVPGNKVVFDSTRSDNPSGALTDFFEALKGAELTLTLNPELQAVSVEGREKLIEALVKANPQMETMLNQVLTREQLKQIAEAAFPALKTTEVKKGDTWTRQGGVALGPIGTYETKYTYTDDGPDKDANVEKISVKVETTYRKSTDVVGRFPFKVNDAELKTAEGSGGSVTFRKDRGRAERSEMKVTLKGKMNVDVGGSGSNVDVTHTQTTTVVTADENPVKKK